VNALPVAALALAFPVLAHLAALRHSDALALAAVAALAGAVAWPMRRRPLAFAVFVLATGAVLVLLARAGHAATALLLPPVLITGAIARQFGASLAPGATPLVQRVVSALHPEALQIPGVPAYTRRVTWLWAVLLGSLCALDALLALLVVPHGLLDVAGLVPFAPISLAQWALAANWGNYLAIGGFFLGEYLYRRTRFPQQPYQGFGDFMARMARLGPGFWRGR